MNLRIEQNFAAPVSPPLAVPAATPRRVEQAALVALAPGVSAVFLDAAASPGPEARARLVAESDADLPRPLFSTTLGLGDGGRRHVLIVAEDAGALVSRRLSIAAGPGAAGLLDPDWLQSPLRDLGALTRNLTPESRDKLARLALATAAPLFRRSGAGAAAERLLDSLGAVRRRAATWRPAGVRAGVLSAPLGAGVPAPAFAAFVVMERARLRRIPGVTQRVEATASGPVLHLHLPAPLPEGARLAALGPAPVIFAPALDDAPQGLAPWLEARPRATQDWILPLLHAAAGQDPVATALLDEIRHGAEGAPAARVTHVSATSAGVLALAALDDPHDLARALRVERGGARTEIAVARGAGWCGGFFELARGAAAEAGCRIALIWRSGRSTTLHDGAVAAYRGETPADLARLPGAPAALAAARCSLGARHRAFQIEDFGASRGMPRLAVVVPASALAEALRARAALIFAEPQAGSVEVVVVAARGAEAEAARRSAADCGAVFGLAHRLVIVAPNAHGSERLAAGLSALRAEAALLLGAEVLPAARGWLGGWLKALSPAAGSALLGGVLLSPEGAVLHAGGTLARGADGAVERKARAPGLLAGDLPRARRLPTASLSAECAGLRGSALEALRDAAARHPSPDVLLSAAAARGGAHILTRQRFVRFAPLPAADPLDAASDAHALGRMLDADGQEA